MEPDVLFSFADPEIVESSGLVATEGLVVTVNDSGDAARAFIVDPGSGETVGVTEGGRWSISGGDGGGAVEVQWGCQSHYWNLMEII